MNQLIEVGKTMMSTEIAQLTGKRHDHVIRDIEAIIKQLNDSPNLGSGFESTTYTAGNGKQEKCYRLNYEATMTLITGYDVVIRASVIKRWQELEQQSALSQFKVPTSLSEALILAGQIQAQKEAALLEVAKLNSIIDNEFGYSSIIRAAKFLGVHESTFNWQTLKRVTIGLGFEVKRVPSPRFEYQNLYPIKAFQTAYPEHDFDDLKPELIDDKAKLSNFDIKRVQYGLKQNQPTKQ